MKAIWIALGLAVLLLSSILLAFVPLSDIRLASSTLGTGSNWPTVSVPQNAPSSTAVGTSANGPAAKNESAGSGSNYTFVPPDWTHVNIGPLPTVNVDYTISGLTCPVPPDYSALGNLVSAVTQDPRFVNLTNGENYVFGNGEMITNRTVTTGGTYDNNTGKAVGGITVYLPDAMELVFYSFGPTTRCGQIPGLISPANQVIVVQVPLQGGEINMTGATFNKLFP